MPGVCPACISSYRAVAEHVMISLEHSALLFFTRRSPVERPGRHPRTEHRIVLRLLDQPHRRGVPFALPRGRRDSATRARW